MKKLTKRKCPICEGTGRMVMGRIDVDPNVCRYCNDGIIQHLTDHKEDMQNDHRTGNRD